MTASSDGTCPEAQSVAGCHSSAERKIDAIENIIRRVSDSRDAPRLQQLTDEERHGFW